MIFLLITHNSQSPGQCCYSCRAFFRRTSVKTPASYRCRSGKNDCIISSGVKSCISCRLQKCLKVREAPCLIQIRFKSLVDREHVFLSYENQKHNILFSRQRMFCTEENLQQEVDCLVQFRLKALVEVQLGTVSQNLLFSCILTI